MRDDIADVAHAREVHHQALEPKPEARVLAGAETAQIQVGAVLLLSLIHILFQVAFGFALRFGEVAGTPRMSFLSAIPLALVALYVICSRRRFPADGRVQLSALAVMAGFLLATQPLLAADSGAADVALLNAGNGLFIMAAQMALITIAARNPLGAITTVAWGNGVSALGSLTGAAAGMLANSAAASMPALRVATPAVDVYKRQQPHSSNPSATSAPNASALAI